MTADKKAEIVEKLGEIYKSPKSELVFHSNYELLVAVILSAQCTDKRVNIVTAELFKEYNTPEKMITLTLSELEQKIKPCGFYHDKAKHIMEASKDLVEKFGGVVPGNKESLRTLAGVGEKTANVVLATGFGIPAIAVDTHVFRVSNRLGLVDAKNVEKTQKALEVTIPEEKWIDMHYSLVLHGRYVCKAQRPNCKECQLQNLCKYYSENNK